MNLNKVMSVILLVLFTLLFYFYDVSLSFSYALMLIVIFILVGSRSGFGFSKFLAILLSAYVVYMIISGDESNRWKTIMAIVLVCYGLKMIFTGASKSKSVGFNYSFNKHYSNSGNREIDYLTLDGKKSHYEISNNLAEKNIDLIGGSNISINIDNNLGLVILNIPSDYQAVVEVSNTLGEIENQKSKSATHIVRITGTNRLGKIIVK